MATIARVTQRNVAPSAAPNIQLQNANTASLTAIGGRQMQAAGAAVSSLGGEMERVRREAIDQANALRVDDALNQLNEQTLKLTYDTKEGYESQTGVNAVSRQSGKPLADEYVESLQKSASSIADSLSNEDQRRMFAMKANNVMTMFYGKAKDFEGKQYRAYNASTREASAKQSSNAIGLNPTDPEYVAFHTTRLRASIEGGRDENGVFVPGLANFEGKSAAWAREAADEAVSAAYAGGVKMLMERGDLNGAMTFRQRHASQFLPKDLLSIDGALEREYDTKRGVVAADQAFERLQSAIAPNDFDRLVGTIKDLESKGQRFGADGKLLQGPVTRSGERAIGEMQVMPSTAADPGYGIKPANLSDPDDIARVGTEKAQMLVKRYGDVRKVLAAYNWGEGNVDKAVKQNGAAWLDLAPAETKAYVDRGMGIYDRPSGGAPRTPTREEVQRIAEASVGRNPSEAVLKAARARVVQRFEDHEKAMAQRETETVVLAQQQLLQNPDFTALPPSTRDALARFAPGKVDDLMSFAKKLRAGQEVETNWNVYADLREAASRAPQVFAKSNLRAHFMNLAPAQREQLLDLQQTLLDPKNAPTVATLDAQLGVAHNLLGFKAGDREKKGQFDSAAMQQIAAEQARKGGALTYEERQKVLDRLMTTGEVPGAFWGTNSKRLYEIAGTEGASAFAPTPSSIEKEKIVAALKRAGKPVTDAEVNRLYRMKAGL
jgi:soluble lytic murein transglycosylase